VFENFELGNLIIVLLSVMIMLVAIRVIGKLMGFSHRMEDSAHNSEQSVSYNNNYYLVWPIDTDRPPTNLHGPFPSETEALEWGSRMARGEYAALKAEDYR